MSEGAVWYSVEPIGSGQVIRREWVGAFDEDVEEFEELGRYTDAGVAYEVAYALCERECEELGYPPEDNRIQYPERPEESTVCHRIWPG